ncbi:MAG TPA: hypothetical protein ENF80_00535 [Thermofilum sp.]|nr:hypothetical protein [Thermofilum sp.]
MVIIKPEKELYVLDLLKTFYRVDENEVSKINIKGKTMIYIPPDKLIIRLGSGRSLRDVKLFLYNVFNKK